MALLLADLVRLVHRPTNELFFRLFGALASPREARGLASSTWYAWGMAATVTAFPMPEAISGILVLALADPAGAYVGVRWGRRSFLGGTVAGTMTVAAVAAAILLIRHPWPPAAAAVVMAALAERRSWPLDDNFTLPLVTGGTVTAVGFLLA